MSNSTITNEFALARLTAKFGDKIISAETPFDLLTIEVPSADAHEIIQWLKEDEVLKVSYLTNLGGVHYPQNEGRELAVVYHLHSLTNNFRIRIKTFLSIENPSIASIVAIHNGANWMERETFDFYGINFVGHSNLKRILNVDEMDYFPLRKEYPLEDQTRIDKDDEMFGR
jgi:NADH-quinone oxidoreductase subunit C